MKKSAFLATVLFAAAVSAQAGELFVFINSGSAMTQAAGNVLAG
ncbi:hypothetical protein [Rhodoferax sp. U2-2l]|nr:hypothetical protein [Rhodoferax sp. U2-2l]